MPYCAWATRIKESREPLHSRRAVVMSAAQELDLTASASGNDSNDLEYPDPASFNLSDRHEQLVFMHK